MDTKELEKPVIYLPPTLPRYAAQLKLLLTFIERSLGEPTEIKDIKSLQRLILELGTRRMH